MKKTIFLVLIIMVLGCISIANVFASSGLTLQETIDMMSQPVQIVDGMYDNYTDSVYGNENANYGNENLNIIKYDNENVTNTSELYMGKGLSYREVTAWHKATIINDDPIVKLIPKELFVHRGNYFYLGKTYGFYVNTIPLDSTGDSFVTNKVEVFVIKNSLTYKNSRLDYKVEPLYTYTFIYISQYLINEKDNLTLNDVDLNLETIRSITDNGVVIPFPKGCYLNVQDLGIIKWQDRDEAKINNDKYGVTKPFFSISLDNANNLNFNDEGYDYSKDYGYRILRSYYTYSGSTIATVAQNFFESVPGYYDAWVKFFTGPIQDAHDIIMATKKMSDSALSNVASLRLDLSHDKDKSELYFGASKEEQFNHLKNTNLENPPKLWKSSSQRINGLLLKPNMFNENQDYADITYNLTCDEQSKALLSYLYGFSIFEDIDETEINIISIRNYNSSMYIGSTVPKKINIGAEQQGYCFTGTSDKFVFTPMYSGEYIFEVNTTKIAKINVYCDGQLINNNNSYHKIILILEGGKEYIFEVEFNFVYTYDENLLIVDGYAGNFKVSISPTKINQLYDAHLDDFMLSKDNEAIVKFVPTESKIYELYFADIRVNQNLLEEFILDYNTYANKSTTISNFFALSYDSNQKIISFFNDETYGPKWQWMLDYIIEKAENQSHTRLDLLTTSPNHTYYRLNIHAFLNEAMYSSGTYVSANFSNMSNETFLPQIRVYDKDFNNLERFNFDEISINDYCNNSFEESLVAYFKAGETYYIHIDRNANANYKFLTASLKIGDSRNEIVLNNNHSYESNEILKIEENIRMFKIPVSGLYEINISARDCSSSKIMLIKNTEVLDILTSFKKEVTINKTVFLDEDDLIYIVYINGGTTEGVINISIVENTELVFYIMTDPYWADQSAQIGTEVTVNGKSYYGNTIAIGFTRCAFLSYNYPYESRLDYIWDSTNESVATVTEYGTITALSVGTTTIRVIDKYKMGYLATLDISVYQATFTDEITVQLSTDLNLDPSHNGTEVIYGLGESAGNYIHVGYSRSICIVGPAPSISRQDYIWTIDNPIAFVSIYGMVYAHTPGEATITGVNKYNSSYVGRIPITVVGIGAQ